MALPEPPTITGVCYEQIEDDFWYGWYLDLTIVMNKITGYVNATKLCTDPGKRFGNWAQNTQTKDQIEAGILLQTIGG